MDRRGFLKESSLAGAATLLAPDWQAAMAAVPAVARVFVTHDDKRHQPAEPVSFSAEPTPSDLSQAIVLDTSQRFQSILGFGAAFTDGSCYTLSQMPASGRQIQKERSNVVDSKA